MDDIDKLNLIFKANDIELGLQLVKSLGFNLKDVLVELYERNKFSKLLEHSYKEEKVIWWILNGNDYIGSNKICIRDSAYDEVRTGNRYTIWIIVKYSGIYQGKSYKTLHECFDLLVNCLEKGEWNT